MYAENEPVLKRNNVPDELYTREADGKIPYNCKYPLVTIQATQNQKQTNTGGLAKFLKFKTGAKVMLIVNLAIQDCQIKGQTGNISPIEFAQGSV